MFRYRKSRGTVPRGFFEAEAKGLQWLGAAALENHGQESDTPESAGHESSTRKSTLHEVRGPRVVEVLGYSDGYLDLERIDSVHATAEAAYTFGQNLAHMHLSGAPYFGYTPAKHAYFGPLSDPVPGVNSKFDSFPDYFINGRMLPMLETGIRRGEFSSQDVADTKNVLERYFNQHSSEPWLNEVAAKVHGDLWSGNLLWAMNKSRSKPDVGSSVESTTPDAHAQESRESGDPQEGGSDARGSEALTDKANDTIAMNESAVEAVLIDPSAHGGHAEEDLAMLTLFGQSYWQEILRGYQKVRPLQPGFEKRFTLHNLYPIAGHVVFFGGGYYSQYKSMLNSLL